MIRISMQIETNNFCLPDKTSVGGINKNDLDYKWIFLAFKHYIF